MNVHRCTSVSAHLDGREGTHWLSINFGGPNSIELTIFAGHGVDLGALAAGINGAKPTPPLEEAAPSGLPGYIVGDPLPDNDIPF